EAWLDCDIAALVLVGIAVGDESEHPGGIFDSTALITAQPDTHSASFDIDVVSCGRVARRRLNHVLDIADLKSAGDDTVIVERVDAAQLQNAGLAGTVYGALHVLVDELDKLTNGRLVDLRAHVIFPPNLKKSECRY